MTQDNNDERSSLISKLLDGELMSDEKEALQRLVGADSGVAELIVDQLMLDSLLSEELGSKPLTALVDLVSGDQESSTVELPKRPTDPKWFRWSGWVAAAAIFLVASFWIARSENNAFASATSVVRAALKSHSEPIERVYSVNAQRESPESQEPVTPRNVRVVTSGDRFWVDMQGKEKSWTWGREVNGDFWLTLGPKRAMRIEADEIGPPLDFLSNLYSLNLETLLNEVLQHCRIEYSSDSDFTHTITARPRRATGWLREARIEVEKETKAIRKLVLMRRIQQAESTVEFTLIESRNPDDSLYSPEGHLESPRRIFTRDSKPDNRHEVLVGWFGSNAERWLRTEETKTNVK